MDKEQKTLLVVGLGLLLLWLAVRRYEAESAFNLDPAQRPFADYKQPFYLQWVWKHDAFSYEGWTDQGYEWCERSELHDIADLIRRAMKTLADDDYPRSQADRKRLLKKFPMRGSREQWDPFHELDTKFYELLSNNGSRYDDAADRWLRETCGITRLDDPPIAK